MTQKMGWQMGGNKDAIWIENDGNQIKLILLF
jgi:hypothetical protein